jgi:IS30 family transposase
MIDKGVQGEVKKLRDKGVSISAIAKTLGISRPSAYKYLGLSNDDRSFHSEDDQHNNIHRTCRHSPPTILRKRDVTLMDHPPENLKKERETTEIVGLRVEAREKHEGA